LHMAQLMQLPLTVSRFSKIQIGFTFWHRLTRVVPDKGPLNVCVCVCVCVNVRVGFRHGNQMPPMVIFAGGHVSGGRYPGGQMSWIHSSRRAGQLVLIVVWRRLVGRSQASTDTRLTPSAAAPTDVQYSAAGRDQHGSAVCVRAAKLISTCAAVAFTARRHASTVYAVDVCPVCLSVRHRPVLYRNDWTNRARFFRMEVSFHLSHSVLCNEKKTGISRN